MNNEYGRELWEELYSSMLDLSSHGLGIGVWRSRWQALRIGGRKARH